MYIWREININLIFDKKTNIHIKEMELQVKIYRRKSLGKGVWNVKTGKGGRIKGWTIHI